MAVVLEIVANQSNRIMSHRKTQIIHATCPFCSAQNFEIRVLKEEGVAAARCVTCCHDYLLLDSEDYWFDVIQGRYPRQSRCSCKGTSFKLTFAYTFREDGDVSSVTFRTSCSSCGRFRRRMVVEIKYTPTEDLVTQPLRYCRNTKIFYDLNEITMYATRNDIARVVHYLGRELNCSFACLLREQNEWVAHILSYEQIKRIILNEGVNLQAINYRQIFAFPGEENVPALEFDNLKEEETFWKRNPVISIASPSVIRWSGQVEALLYYIRFSNEHVDNEEAIPKPREFQEATKRLLNWLKSQFVSWRGRNCFDNPDENVRIFGERFSKRRKIAETR